MKRTVLLAVFFVVAVALGAWSANPFVVGVEQSTKDAWKTVTSQFEATTGISVTIQPIALNSIAQQILQSAAKSSKLQFVMIQTSWTSYLARYLQDLTEVDSQLRAAGITPAVDGGRTLGVPIPFAQGWLLSVLVWPNDRASAVQFLIVAGGGVPAATAALPPKTAGLDVIPPGKLAVSQHNPKMDGALESLFAAAQSALTTAAVSALSALPTTMKAGVDRAAKALGVPFSAETATVTVVLESKPGRSSSSNVAALSALGVSGSSVEASSSLIKVTVPIGQLATLASQLTGVSFIRPPYTPYVLGTPTQGVAAVGATAYHAAGFRGAGVKVAVIDLGFSGLSAAQSRGDLPSGAVQNDLTGTGIQSGISHGTAVAEIVCDIAPDAQLYLLKIADEVDLDAAVTYCLDSGIDIINHSLGWYNTNYYDGTGTICDIARRATNGGILWVNAAGNEAQSHWEGAFVDGNGDGWNDQDITLYAASGSPIILYMTWNEWPQSSTDYDLYLYDPSGAVAASSTKHQTGTEEPTESIQTTATQSGTYRIRFQGAGSRSLEIYSLYQGVTPYVSGSSLLAPADLAEAVTVAAINYASYTTGPQEPYSSQGPTNDGRTKPDLACPDNVATGTAPYTTFPGTSGAAPHAAGAAALLLSRQPTLSGTALRAQLLVNTVAMGSANIYGQGRLVLQAPSAPNQAPTASFTYSPSAPSVATAVSFNAAASSDSDGSIVAYTWSFGDGATGSGVATSHAYAAPGAYTAGLTVQDDDGATNSTTRTVSVQTPAMPDLIVTALSYAPTNPTTGQHISFAASVANQGTGAAGQFRVLLDGGLSSGSAYVAQLAAGATTSLTFSLPLGSSPQTFTARADDLGQIGESNESNNTRAVTISATTPPPVAEAGGPYAGNAGTPIAFNGSASSGSITTYSWAFGDGVTAQGVTPSHAYAAPGTYTATLTAYGPGGQSSDSANVSVSAITPPPTAEAGGPYAGTVGVPMVLNGSASSGSITTYSWAFGDGVTAQGVTPSHAYAAPGTYTATLTAYGPGGQSSDSANVSVSAITPPPTAEAGGPYAGTVGVPMVLNGSASSGSITTYSWAFGDGVTAQGVTPSHAYAAPGTYTATLTAYGPGGQSSDSASISVAAAQPALAASVAVSKSTYQVGESISVSITTNRAAYVYLCEVRADQRVLLIYPNRFQPNNLQGAGTQTLPGSGYSLRAAAPVGNETFYLFAATAPVPGFPTSFGSDFPVLSTSPDAFRNNVLATMQSLVPSADRTFASQAFSVVAAPPSGGTLRVVTTPAGAAVRLDGSSIGTSPVERTNVAVGQHTVQLSLTGYEVATRQVSIQAGATTTLTVTLTALATNQPPSASFTLAPASPPAGQPVTFDASASSDPGGTITAYAWDFGDGTSATGLSPTHTYAATGSYAVVLTVTDNGGLSRSVSKSVSVTSAPATEDSSWVFPVLPTTVAEGWSDAASAIDGNYATGAKHAETRTNWTNYITFVAPGGGLFCDGVRFRASFPDPGHTVSPGGAAGQTYELGLTWQVEVRTSTGWSKVYEGPFVRGQWIDTRFAAQVVLEIRLRAHADRYNGLQPILLEVNLHSASS